MVLELNLPEDEEFERMLKETLKKPMSWYEERADRAVRFAVYGKRRATRVPRKG